MDYWFGSSMNFQDAGKGKILAVGDFAITADEVNPVLSVLAENHFGIVALHSHTLYEQPRIFFLHFWKIGAPSEVGAGLKSALAVVHAR